MPLAVFSCPIVLANTSKTMLKNVGKLIILALILTLVGMSNISESKIIALELKFVFYHFKEGFMHFCFSRDFYYHKFLIKYKFNYVILLSKGDFPVAQMVKNLPAIQETRVWSLGQEDPLEKGMAIHFSIFAWRIPWTEKLGGLQSMEFAKPFNVQRKIKSS